MADDRKIEKQLTAIFDRIESKDTKALRGSSLRGEGVDITDGSEFEDLKDYLEDVHTELDKEQDELIDYAATNKTANFIQIAKELLEYKREREFYKNQKEHNKESKHGRIRIIEQNDEIIASNQDVQKLLKDLRKEGTGGGGKGDGSGEGGGGGERSILGADGKPLRKPLTDAGDSPAASKVSVIAGDVRAGAGYAGGTTNRAASMSSRASGTLSKNMGDNSEKIQKRMDDLAEKDADAANKAQQELAKLTKMMAAAASGEKDVKGNQVTADEVRVQAARVEQTMSSSFEKLGKGEGQGMNDLLGMGAVRDDLSSERGFTTSIKNFAGIDSDAGFGKGLKQAFTAERLFGKDSKLTTLFGGGRKKVEDRVAAATAKQELAVEDQIANTQHLVSAKDVEAEDTKGAKEKETEIDKDTKDTSKAVDAAADEAAEAAAAEKEKAGEAEAAENREERQERNTKKKEKSSERTGQDTESIQEKQLETLIEIRDILSRTAGMGGGGRGGLLPTVAKVGLAGGLWAGAKKMGGKFFGGAKNLAVKGGTALKGAGPATQGFAQGTGGGLFKGALRGATRLGGAIAGVGMGVYEGVTGFRDAEARADAGELTAEEEQVAKGEAIGGGAGGAGGAIAGAAAGAAIGSIIPVVGTVIGGIIGGAIGYWAGKKAGTKVGGAIADAIDVSESQLAESNELAETTLKDVEEKNPELVATIRQEAKEIEAQLLEEAGDEVSDNDKAAIKNAGLVTAIRNHTAEIDALAAGGGEGGGGERRGGPRAQRAAIAADLADLAEDNKNNLKVDYQEGRQLETDSQAAIDKMLQDNPMDSTRLEKDVDFGGPDETVKVYSDPKMQAEYEELKSQNKAAKKKAADAMKEYKLLDEVVVGGPWRDTSSNSKNQFAALQARGDLSNLETGPDGESSTGPGRSSSSKMSHTINGVTTHYSRSGVNRDYDAMIKRELMKPVGDTLTPADDTPVGDTLTPADDTPVGDTVQGTAERTQKISGTFSEMKLALDNPEAYKEFQELKKKYKGDRTEVRTAKAINEWGRMGRTEGWGNIERSEDGKTVHRGIEMDNLHQGSLESVPVPTGDAIDNMTNLAAQTTADTPATVIVANQPAPPAPAVPSDDGPTIAMMPPRVRTSDSVMQRYQDKRFRV